MYYNHACVMGRIVAAPTFNKGKKEDGSDDRCWVRLAVNRPMKDSGTDFILACAWGPRARVLADYGEKGKVVLVSGSLRTNNKLKADGSYDNYTEISVVQIVLGPKAKNSPSQAKQEDNPPAEPQQPQFDIAALAALLAAQVPTQTQQPIVEEHISEDPFG